MNKSILQRVIGSFSFIFGFLIIRLRFILLLFVVIAYGGFLYWLPETPTIAVVHAKTEQITYVVTVPEMARIRLSGLGVRGETILVQSGSANTPRQSARPASSVVPAASNQGPRRLTCLGGLLQPTTGTKVTIRRSGTNPVRIILERLDDKPVAEFRGSDVSVPQEYQRAGWLMVEETEACGSEPPKRFQINGIVEIGDELRPEISASEPSSAPIIEGRVEIYGKTIDTGMLFGDSRPRIYPVTEVSIPPGARVLEAASIDGKAGNQIWSGMVYTEPEVSALQAEVTTEAKSLAVFRPGLGLDPDLIKVSMFAQMFNDPNLLSLQMILAILFGLIQSIGGFAARIKK